MFLNIGKKQSVLYDDIIAVIDIEKSKSKINSEFIEYMMKNDSCIVLGKVIRSAIIVEKNGECIVYLSPVSIMSLKKRLLIMNTFRKNKVG